MITQAEFEAKSERQRKESFARWLAQPMTRAMLSMIPPTDKDILRTLLEEAFNQGFGIGSAAILVEVVEALMKGPRR